MLTLSKAGPKRPDPALPPAAARSGETRARSEDAPRRSPSWHLWLLSAALLTALIGYWKVEAGPRGAAHDAAPGEAKAGSPLHRLAVKLEKDAVKLEKEAGIDLPEEYRAIRPAGVDGALPPIPPSETWPAQ
jgi:hypothetical protein